MRLPVLPVLVSLVVSGAPGPAHATAADATARQSAPTRAADSPWGSVTSGAWAWPVAPAAVVARFVEPSSAYGPGHRGIDLQSVRGDVVVAPADGVVAFSGRVAGRGVVTIDHGQGLVSTLEPVVPELRPGDSVRRGQRVALLDVGGHAREGTLHLGVRRDGVYIDPLTLLSRPPRAVLLPCCE